MEVVEKRDINIFSSILGFILKKIVAGGGFIFRFLIFLLDLTLKMLSAILEKCILSKWDWWNSRQETEETNYQIEILGDAESTKHEYKLKRSKEFTRIYNDLVSNVKVTQSGLTVILDYELSQDIVKKVDRIIYLTEKEALNQGYKFATATKCELEPGEIYNKYIINQIMKGE